MAPLGHIRYCAGKLPTSDRNHLLVQMPIFFVAIPVQILLGLLTMLLTLPAVLWWFLNYYQTTFSRILLPG